MIICPQCKTEVDYRVIQHKDNPQCEFCGKILLAEALKKQQELKTMGQFDLKIKDKNAINTKRMGQKLQNLGDDELFGDLEPFNLDEENPLDEVAEDERKLLPNGTKKGTSKSQVTSSSGKKFTNPMEKSRLMKKLKEDQDLFGSLDNK